MKLTVTFDYIVHKGAGFQGSHQRNLFILGPVKSVETEGMMVHWIDREFL